MGIKKFSAVSQLTTQKIEDYPDVKMVRDKARQFAATYVKELASEMVEWQDTGLLRDGRLRELAKILENVDEYDAMALAQLTAHRAALDAIIAGK